MGGHRWRGVHTIGQTSGGFGGNVSGAGGLTNEKVIVGVCAMAKKVNAKPMRAILGRLESAGDIRVERFGDKVILEVWGPEWRCVVLHSAGRHLCIKCLKLLLVLKR